ncbi:MAG: TadE family protein [Pseudomonadota bacterium]
MKRRTESVIGKFREFTNDTRGMAAVEFVFMLPLSVGILVMSAEYGNGLMTREALDSAVRDATRVLSRAPLKQDSSGDPVLQPYFVDKAKQMIADRIGRKVEEITFQATATILPTGGLLPPGVELRTEVIRIDTQASVGLNLGLLNYIRNITLSAGASPENAIVTSLTMFAGDRARYGGEIALGVVACNAFDADQALC